LFAGMVSANTNIAVWVGGDTPTTFISGSGTMVAPYFAGNGSLLTAISAANLTAGSSLTAVNGLAVTNISAANLKAGTIATAISGSEITNMSSANLAGNIAVARLTNAVGVSAATIAVTNRGVGYTNVITFFGTFSGTVEP
jgi:hypothetical protein